MAKVSNPFAMSCVLSTVGLAALVANSLIIVRYGRRRVLMTNGLVIFGVLQLIIAIVYDKNPGTMDTGKVIIGLTTIYISAYNVRLKILCDSTVIQPTNEARIQAMIAPYAWLSGGELPS